ncbi:MAG TPA: hypothetical protein PKC45_19460, partial [Gemmatales bacterium]|nr:hypothetical protein [Gemmatales bacterium]
TPIPNGTPVTVKGAEQIQHIWLDGKVVKVVDQSVVADLSGQRFQQSRAYWTVLAVLGLFVLVLGTVYLYVRRRGPSAVA